MKTRLSLIIVFYDLGKEHVTYTAHFGGDLYDRAEEYAYKLFEELQKTRNDIKYFDIFTEREYDKIFK